MGSLSVVPILSVQKEANERNPNRAAVQVTDLKIQDLVPRVALPKVREGSLFASATAPFVVIPDAKEQGHQIRGKPKRNGRRKGEAPASYCPIGLWKVDEYPWINALMQFMLFFPSLREVFSYTPQSLFPFNEFIDRYFLDVEEMRFVSQASGLALARCLMGKFPHLFQTKGVANLHETIHVLSQSAWALPDGVETHRPEWQLLWDEEKEFGAQELFQRSSEWLVGLQGLYDPKTRQKPFCNALQKQYYATDLTASFELDGFIEYRGDEERPGHYVTYLKLGGDWVQCADERIAPLKRSKTLDIPLRRSILFHYRRTSTRAVGILR